MAYVLHPNQKGTKNIASIVKLGLNTGKTSEHKHMGSFE